MHQTTSIFGGIPLKESGFLSRRTGTEVVIYKRLKKDLKTCFFFWVDIVFFFLNLTFFLGRKRVFLLFLLKFVFYKFPPNDFSNSMSNV